MPLISSPSCKSTQHVLISAPLHRIFLHSQGSCISRSRCKRNLIEVYQPGRSALTPEISPRLVRCQAARGAQTAEQCQLRVEDLTPEAFQPFGQVCGPVDDGKGFGADDAQLVLDKGTPRFYIMELPRRGLAFDRITYHERVTQCLGATGERPWYMVVAAPSGSVEAYPQPENLRAFRIPPGHFIKLHEGTWHAGPLFDAPDTMSFFNLELADTNVVDHNTHVYAHEGVSFQLVE